MNFTENKGQVVDMNFRLRSDILYVGDGGSSKVYLRKTGWSYVLCKLEDNTIGREPQDYINEGGKTKLDDEQNVYDEIKMHRIDVDFIGANPDAKILNSEKVEGYSNFYLGHCPKGVIHVNSYNRVVYQNVYNNIDVIFYGGKQSGLKYDIVVRPGGNPNDIKIKYTGADGIEINNGKLTIENSLGEIYENIPKVYQNINGKIVDVKSQYILENDILNFSFSIFNSSFPLIIDPWLSFYGGILNDVGTSVETDPSGNVVFCGYTESSNFPVSSGAFQTRLVSYKADAFVVKMDANGIRQWATYYGDSINDVARGIATDNLGNVIVVGNTGSINFPIGAAAGNFIHQGSKAGSSDAFVLKFDPAGIRLWSTYYGGTYSDGGSSVVTDGSNIYLYGDTYSDNAISMGSVFQSTLNGTAGSATGKDIFVAKFDATGNRVWGSYAGGTNNDEAAGIEYDVVSGDLYISGSTYSNNFPSSGGHQMSLGGVYDAFLFKFSSAGQRLWATYYGGSAFDWGSGLAIDGSGNIILSGLTASSNPGAISSVGAYQIGFGGGVVPASYDGFIVKFDNAGTRLWSTYLGGNRGDWIIDLEVDDQDNIYAFGEWEDDDRGNYPISPCAYQTNQLTMGLGGSILLGNAEDEFIARYDPNGNQTCITVLGGSDEDELEFRKGGIAIDGYAMYLTGSTRSNDYPVTPGAFQTLMGTGSDVFINRMCTNICEPRNLGLDFTASATNVCANVPITFTPSINYTCDTVEFQYYWDFPGGTPSSSTAINPTVSYISSGAFNVKLLLKTACRDDSVIKTNYINVNGANAQPAIGSNIKCNGQTNGSAIVNPIGGTSPYVFSWNMGSTTSSISGLSIGNYTCVVTDFNLCVTTYTVNITEPLLLTVGPTVIADVLCNGDNSGSASALAGGGITPYQYNWLPVGGTSSTASGLNAGNYTVTVLDSNNCVSTATVSITEPLSIIINPSANDDTCALGLGSATAVPSGGAGGFSYSWNNGSTTNSISGLTTGTYSVVVNDANNCTKIISISINNIAGPVADAGSAVSINLGESTSLNGSGGVSYNWSPSTTLSCTTCSNPMASPTETTMYILVVTDESGCSSSDSVIVTVSLECGLFYVPNAFSPNGDGENDVLALYTNSICLKSFIFTIYDRWGEKIFETNNINDYWDGRFKGKDLDVGVFSFLIMSTLNDKETTIRKGNVTLVR